MKTDHHATDMEGVCWRGRAANVLSLLAVLAASCAFLSHFFQWRTGCWCSNFCKARARRKSGTVLAPCRHGGASRSSCIKYSSTVCRLRSLLPPSTLKLDHRGACSQPSRHRRTSSHVAPTSLHPLLHMAHHQSQHCRLNWT